MVTISIDELVEALEEKRDQAINWREDCEGFGDVRGMYASYISQLFRREKVDRSTIEAVEDRMFREHGSYYAEIKEAEETPTQHPKPVMTEGMGILLKQIISIIGAISSSVAKNESNTDKVVFRIDGFKASQDKKMDEIIKAVKESNAANEVIL